MDYRKLMELCSQTIEDFVATDAQSKLLLEYMRDDHRLTRDVFDYHCFDVHDDWFRFGRSREIGDVKSVVTAVLEHARRLSMLSLEIMTMLEDE